MQGDFSRDSFDPTRHYSRVLQQQGRAELDADANERQAIQLHLLRRLSRAMFGVGGSGADDGGFAITPAAEKGLPGRFTVTRGCYFVDGWMSENETDKVIDAETQVIRPVQDRQTPTTKQIEAGIYLAVLDVWECHVCAFEVDAGNLRSTGSLREPALSGVDTATRAQLTWHVRLLKEDRAGGANFPRMDVDGGTTFDRVGFHERWQDTWMEHFQHAHRGALRARAADPAKAAAASPCVVAPEARYRGQENQLYRVEVFENGTAAGGATFVWSRENASVVFPVSRFQGPQVRLAQGWRDAALGLAVGDWVESRDDSHVAAVAHGTLARVIAVDPDTLTLTLDRLVPPADASATPVLRRWEDEAKSIAESDSATTGWLTLEDGVEVQFSAEPARETDAKGSTHQYRTGDFWLIPARTALGDVLWPQRDGLPKVQPPHRDCEHHYAPLAVLDLSNPSAPITQDQITDLTRRLAPAWHS